MNAPDPKPRRYGFREKLGALALDMPRFLGHVVRPACLGGDWTRYRNRHDKVVEHPDGKGIHCAWPYTRNLHLAGVFPSTAQAIMRRALEEWPIQFAGEPTSWSPDQSCASDQSEVNGDIEISFIIGHRGTARLPHLLLVLKSIAAQQGVRFECMVVEQDVEGRIRDRLPPWVRYIHTPPSDPDMPYCRSWAFNVAAQAARSNLLVFHDNDMLVPAHYGRELVELNHRGYEVINLKRFIFYLASSNQDIERVLAGGDRSLVVDSVIENLEAGGSLAITMEAFRAIGGFDEEFIGWGGEDNEFWDRCLTRNVWSYAYLPILHVWHEAQPGKRADSGMGSQTADLFIRRKAIPVETRIRELKARFIKRTDMATLPSPSEPASAQPVPGMVSVIIPVFNRAKLLPASVDSVLRQTYSNYEVILVDDGSTDDTASVMRELESGNQGKIVNVFQSNRGVGCAREAGRRVARGEFIQYLDSDDGLHPEKFACQVALLQSHPEVDIAFGITRLVDESGNVQSPVYKWTGQDRAALFPGLLVDRWWCTHTPLWRRALCDRIGAWSSMRHSEDWEYEARAGALGARLLRVDQVVSDHRSHGGPRLTGKNWISTQDQARFLSRLFACARAADVPLACEEMRHFARWAFAAARNAGALGDKPSAIQLLALAKAASLYPADMLFYRCTTLLLGWRLPVQMADGLHRRLGRKYGQHTKPQSWANAR